MLTNTEEKTIVIPKCLESLVSVFRNAHECNDALSDLIRLQVLIHRSREGFDEFDENDRKAFQTLLLIMEYAHDAMRGFLKELSTAPKGA